jgi:opacity protein-like surface antigen
VGDEVVTQDRIMVQPEVGYSLLAGAWGGLDVLVGARYSYLSADFSVSSGGTVVAETSGRTEWFDGTAGLRIRVRADPEWHLFAKGDVGGGGSNFTWQAFAGAAFDFAQCCSAVVAYRHLDVDYEHDRVVDDVYLSGPAIGVQFRL